MAKIVVLGSSAATPFPRTKTNRFSDYRDIETYRRKYRLHDDLVCRLAAKGGKQRRTRACIAVVVRGRTILIDAGPDILFQLRRARLKPDAVVITHQHADASFGLRYLKDTPVYSEARGNIKPSKQQKILGLTVLPFRVIHAAKCRCVGYKFWLGHKSFAYVVDIASTRGIKKYVSGCDLFFIDGSSLKTNLRTHLSITDQLKIYKRWNLKKIIITHIGHQTLPQQKLIKFVRSLYPNSTVAYDGQTIRL